MTNTDGDHPEEQGLKLIQKPYALPTKRLDGDHPEEQGLKPGQALSLDVWVMALDGDHPEEQGLKLWRIYRPSANVPA